MIHTIPAPRLSLGVKIGVLGVLLAPIACAAAANAGRQWTVRNQPAHVVNGSPILFQVQIPERRSASAKTLDPVRSVTATWLGHEIAFAFDRQRKDWFVVAGASLGAQPGAYALQLRAETESGQTITYTQTIHLFHHSYPTVKLTVPSRYTAPSPEDQKKIEEDKKVKEAAFKTMTPDRQWSGSFNPPAAAEVSDVFGVQRVFNGTVQSTHQGLDYRVHTGTPVMAVNRGTVILARSLFFEGNCIAIDHGQGLITLYLHLSELRVKEGEQVGKGHVIGVSGGTGRATGPHLHLAVRWQGTYLDPAVLLSLQLP